MSLRSQCCEPNDLIVSSVCKGHRYFDVLPTQFHSLSNQALDGDFHFCLAPLLALDGTEFQ